MPIAQGIWSNVKLNPVSGCWEWTGVVKKDGYPVGRYMGRSLHRHRIAAICWLKFEDWRNTKLFVCHTCDNRRCLNPKHLYIGNAKQNIRDSVERKRQHQVRKTHCPEGHPYNEENTYTSPRGGRMCRMCNRAAVSKYWYSEKAKR